MSAVSATATGLSKVVRASIIRRKRLTRWYLGVILCVAALSLVGYWLVFSLYTVVKCDGAGYQRGDVYLGFCPSHFGFSFEHTGIYWGKDPSVVSHLRQADVLLTGPSTTQLGFSVPTVDAWFASKNLHYYLLGFSFSESSEFGWDIVRRLSLAPRLIVVNSDGTFMNQTSEPAKIAMAGGPVVEANYWLNEKLQAFMKDMCRPQGRLAKVRKICGGDAGVFRSRDTGAWSLAVTPPSIYPLALSPREPMPATLAKSITRARKLKNDMAAKGICMAIMTVPRDHIDMDRGKAIAAAIKVPYLSAPVTGLWTIDHFHLTESSAEKWSSAILPQLEPILARCPRRAP